MPTPRPHYRCPSLSSAYFVVEASAVSLVARRMCSCSCFVGLATGSLLRWSRCQSEGSHSNRRLVRLGHIGVACRVCEDWASAAVGSPSCDADPANVQMGAGVSQVAWSKVLKEARKKHGSSLQKTTYQSAHSSFVPSFCSDLNSPARRTIRPNRNRIQFCLELLPFARWTQQDTSVIAVYELDRVLFVALASWKASVRNVEVVKVDASLT